MEDEFEVVVEELEEVSPKHPGDGTIAIAILVSPY